MKHSLALSALAVAGPAAARVFNIAEVRGNDDGCKDVHIFVSRGFNEPYPGRIGTLVNSVCGNLDSCDYENVIYDNKQGTVYCDAVYEGSTNGVSQMKAYNEECPDSKLVLIGYSQGADVAGNILVGGGGDIFGCTQKSNEGLGASSKAGKAIAAALTFGDVRHTANQAWNTLGGANANGVSPRTPAMLAGLAAYGPALRDYCNKGDGICGDGDQVEDHLNYFKLYIQTATDFILERLRAVSGDKSASSTGAHNNTLTTPTASHPVVTPTPIGHNNGTIPGGNHNGGGSGNGNGEVDVTVTVPCNNEPAQVTEKPHVVTEVITATSTVTEDCDSKGAVLTTTTVVTVKCPICLHAPHYSTATGLYETPVSSGFSAVPTHGSGGNGNGEHPKWTTSAGLVPGSGSGNGGAPSTVGLPAPTGVLPSQTSGGNGGSDKAPTAVPSAPVSGGSVVVPGLAGLVGVAALMALI